MQACTSKIGRVISSSRMEGEGEGRVGEGREKTVE